MDHQHGKMLMELMAADFTAIDLGLYLNTHPCDQRALSLYRNCALKAKMLRECYEKMYGPLTHMSPHSTEGCKWRWIEEPWPWEHKRI
jgi:spore coat protein JB